MGQSVSNQLGIGALGYGADPAYIQQQILQQRERGFQQIANPQQQLAARLGSMLGGGLTNLAQDRGFFEVNDPLLNKVTQIQGIYNQVASQIDPAANPEQFFTALQSEYSKAGLGQQAIMASQEAMKAKKEGLATQAAELTLYEKHPEVISKELQALAPRIEAGDEKALQRYNELSTLMVRATNKQNLEEQAKLSDIEYKQALGAKASKEGIQLQPHMNPAGMRIGTEVYKDGVLTGIIRGGKLYPATGGQATPAPATPEKPNTSGGRQMGANRDWTKAYDN